MQARTVEREHPSFGAGQLVLRLGVTLACLLLLSVTLSQLFKTELSALARYFYASFGVWGAGIGTGLADGFNFPVPPQAYMLLAEANGSVLQTFPAIALGSLTGGVCGYLVAPILMRLQWIRALVERTQSKVSTLFDRHWVAASLALSLSPIAFSWLCYSAALYRAPRRTLALLCLLRVPKLALYQMLISWGWS
jgi:hypothetical protein